MTEAFLGLKLKALLHTDVRLEGIVSDIDPATYQMTLKDVTLFFPGQPPHYTPIYGVFGKDIKDLQVFELVTGSVSSKAPENHILDHTPPLYQEKTLAPTRSTSKNRKTKPALRNHKKAENTWAGEDVNIFKEEEFDFQKNLDMFDKAKIFAEIRESDETAPEELLVTLNRLPQKKVNLLPSENVLEVEQTPYHTIDNSEEDEEDDDDDNIGDESDNDSQTPDEYIKNKRRQRNSPVSTAKIITANGILCPSVSPLQMAHVEHECSQVSDMFAELAIESGGRGTALLALQQIRPNAKVIILAGNNKNGALGLVAARHLVNHGCLVTVCIAVAHPMHLSNAVARYESLATQCGVSVCYSSNQLQDADMVIDALLGIDDKLVDISDRPTYDIVCQSIDWANQQSRPILAVDFPSGMDASTGIPHHPEHKICPTWTLCLNAPKTGCKSLKTTGELYLVDTGIPRLCWKRVGIKGNTIPWGADFLVALQYNE